MTLDELAQTNEELLERWQRTMEALRPVLEALYEAMLEWGCKLAEALRPIIVALSEWVEMVQREELYRCLRRWHMPHSLACFLARRWPRRWLSGLEA